jgi:probable HAF family extracellular repeat protein
MKISRYRAGACSAPAKPIVLAIATFCAAGLFALETCAQSYLVTDLGTNAFPQGINNNGDVVGYVTIPGVPGGAERAFFYTNGVMTSLSAGPGTTNSGANGINDLGQSVGWYQDSSGGVHGFRSTNCATLTDLGVGAAPLNFPYNLNGAAGINDAGQIVGNRANGLPQAYLLLTNPATIGMPGLPGSSQSLSSVGAVNSKGVVAYTAWTNNSFFSRACTYNVGVQTFIPTPANKASFSVGINDSNQVAGYFQQTNPAVTQAFWYDGTTLTIVGGTAGLSRAYGINNYGQMIGTDFNTNASTLSVFLFDTNNGMSDVNATLISGAGWAMASPAGINDAGQIIGRGVTVSNVQQRGVLLTPALFFNPSAFKYNKNTGNVTMTVSGLNGQQVIIQVSCDLTTWVSISTNTVSQNRATFSDSGTCSSGIRMYRAVVVQ